METTKKKNLYQKILEVQTDLKVEKGQLNKFGGYYYRSCEDILEAVKPLLKKAGLIMTMEDEIVNIGDRFYVKAKVIVNDGEQLIEAAAYAREEETKKGMDGSQITGSASSYARKYALAGLWLVDDGKDSDSDDNTAPRTAVKQKVVATPTPEKNEASVAPEQWECEGCGTPIKQAVHTFSTHNFGRDLCFSCQGKENDKGDA